jgi:transcriptional regulator with XRE-family HTH domain
MSLGLHIFNLLHFSHIFIENSNKILIFVAEMKNKLYKERRKHIGRLLQHERNCLHLDQEDIARMFGVRQELISKIEVGSRKIDILELIDFCKALGLSLTEFSWKIETYLSALSLLPLPKTNLLDKKIKVDVSWLENKFYALLGGVVSETIEFAADSFIELKKKTEEGLESYIIMMEAKGNNLPLWLLNKKYDFEYKYLDAASMLNAYNPYISLAAISRVSGINQNLLSQYANGIKNARTSQMKRIMDAIHIIGKELMSGVV